VCWISRISRWKINSNMQSQRKRILACDGTHWMLMSVNTNLEKAPGWRWLWEVHSKEKIPGSRPIRRKFFTGNVKSWPVHGLCGRLCIFSDCLSSFQKWTILKTSCLINYNVIQNTLIFVGECSVLRFKVSSALKLLGNSSVGVMDPQIHCAVVTLVVSNCLKKLMSHSCPSSYFVLLRYAGTGTGVGVQGKGVVTRGPSTYARGMSSNTSLFSLL
jgi:hypothetical protein